MEVILEEVVQAVGGDGVGDDGGAGGFGREDGGHHGDEGVAAHVRAVGEDGAHAVDVGVKDEAEVGMVFHHGVLDGAHGVSVLRVRDVVREVPVRVEKLAARRVRTERGEDAPGEEATRAVARIDDDVHACERSLRAAECVADFFA